MRTSTRTIAAALAVAAIAIPTTVHAESTPTLSDPIAEGLAGPLQLTVSGDTVYVGQSFAGLLTKITPQGSEVIAVNPDGEIAGSAVDGQTVVYTTRNGPPVGPPDSSTLSRVRRGTTSVVADLLAYETENNPDADVEYGFEEISDECAALLRPTRPAHLHGSRRLARLRRRRRCPQVVRRRRRRERHPRRLVEG